MEPLCPVDPSRLRWLRPEGVSSADFEAARSRIAQWLVQGGLAPVYEAKRRAIYRVDDALLGPLALKEVRSGNRIRSLYFGAAREHPGLREFRVGAAFAARGGATPAWLAAAVEGRGALVRRVVLCMRWLPESSTLGEFLREARGEPDGAVLDDVALSLTGAACLGLVHGRHSGANLLARRRRPHRVDVQVIDFAYARLGEGFDAHGFGRDAARVAATLWRAGQLTPGAAGRLLDAVGDTWPGADRGSAARWYLRAELGRFLRQWALEPGGIPGCDEPAAPTDEATGERRAREEAKARIEGLRAEIERLGALLQRQRGDADAAAAERSLARLLGAYREIRALCADHEIPLPRLPQAISGASPGRSARTQAERPRQDAPEDRSARPR